MLGACAAPTPPPPMPLPADPPPVTATAASAEVSPTTLAPNQRLALGGGVTVRFSGVTVESIEASPDGSYPGGSGVTLVLVFEGSAAPVRREISLLSAGYDSIREAWLDTYRVEVIEVEDPTRAPRLVLIAERVTDRVRPEQPLRVRVQRGGEVALGSTRMKFLGHSTKEIDAGESPPLLVAVEYQPLRGELERLETHVGADVNPQRWRWRDYLFTIDSYAYDAWMELSIARLELAPAHN
ncbi:MAG: hypothetical protein IPK80_10090 [Nannocystis sp.]|nr:hypothetical protein [Nannocystis sp.]